MEDPDLIFADGLHERAMRGLEDSKSNIRFDCLPIREDRSETLRRIYQFHGAGEYDFAISTFALRKKLRMPFAGAAIQGRGLRRINYPTSGHAAGESAILRNEATRARRLFHARGGTYRHRPVWATLQ